MITATPRVRGLAIRHALARAGVAMSPEFEAAVMPRPREKIVTGGWQAGKSTEGAAEIFSDFPLLDPERLTKDGIGYRYGVITPSYRSPRTEIEYLRNWSRDMGVLSGEHFPEGEAAKLRMFDGKVEVTQLTAQDPEGIAGYPYDGILGVEAGQMPELIRTQAQGRIITRRGWITWTGTLEDDEAKPRWVWYGQLADRWMTNPTGDHAAYSLPSWANLTVFPGGRRDPEIERQRGILDEHSFSRRIAGVPSGVQFPVYGKVSLPEVIDWREDVSEAVWARWGFRVTADQPWITALGAGGHDYGESYGHPSTLAAITVTSGDVAVVRDAWEEMTSDSELIESRRLLMSQRYGIHPGRWAFDPMQREAAKIKGVMVAGGDRLVRVGYTEARANADKLKFDFSVPAVRKLFAQMQRVHFIKKFIAGQGEVYEYARVDDDLVAAMEDALYVIKMGPSPIPAQSKATISLPDRREQRSLLGSV